MVLAWYHPEDWAKWCELCPGKMDESFEAWLIHADRTLLQMVRQGITVHRSEIRPDEFEEWCKRENRALNGQSRSEYASAKFAKLHAALFRPYEPPDTVPSRKQVYRDMREAAHSGFSLSELLEPFLRRPKGCICPLFRRRQDEKLEHYGSGVLTSIGERQFLLTAAHVLDDALATEVLIPSKNGFLSLEGEMATTCEDGAQRRKQDRLDVGFYLISEEQANAIHDELVFLNEPDLGPLDLTDAGDAYSIVGYPAFKSKGTETSLTVFDGAGLNDAYRDLLVDERTHLIVRFRPDRAINYARAL
jgi:hypothetical protein